MPFEIQSGQRSESPPLTTVDLWGQYARPAKATHWQDGRSAMELARAWTNLGETLPKEIREALELDKPGSRFEGLQIERGVAEVKTYFPDGVAGPRNHDLVLFGARDGERVLIDIEGKEREEFDKTLKRQWNQRSADNPSSNIRPRLRRWPQLLLGRPREEWDELPSNLEGLRYQLFSGIIGTLLRARLSGSGVAVFLVHQFRHQNPTAALASKYGKNERDLNAFLTWLNPSTPAGQGANWMTRLRRAGDDATLFEGVELWVAKATCELVP